MGLQRELRKTAQALIPEIEILAEPVLPPPGVKLLWAILWKHSPWLEILDNHAFLLQISSQPSPFSEVRNIVQLINQQLSQEQRVRVGIAENPFLAQALVKWSYLEKVPGAVYRKVGRQHVVISPGITSTSVSESSRRRSSHLKTRQEIAAEKPERGIVSTQWIEQLPIQALWKLSLQERTELLRLGIRRLGDLQMISTEDLMTRFGTSAIRWLEYNDQSPGGKVNVNYPPVTKTGLECTNR